MKAKIIKGSHSLMKGLNEISILQIIREHGPISRSDIAHLLNVSIPTAIRVTDSLLAMDLIIDVGQGSSSGGRSAPNLDINPKGAYIFGAQIMNNIDLLLTNFKADIIDFTSVPAEQFDNPEDIIKYISDMIETMVKKHNVPTQKIYGVGIGTPGINFKAGHQIQSSAFKGWNNVNIDEILQKNFNYKVFIENVSFTTTLQEYWFGNGKGHNNIIHLLVERGIGGGIILDGKLYKGFNGKAGILGHISVESEGDECYCGNKGCVELYSSIPAIVKKVREQLNLGFSSSLNELNKPVQNISFKDICKESENGDVLSCRVIKDAGKKLGTVLSSLANIFDPELIILSGSAIEDSDLFFEACRSEAFDRIFSYMKVNKRLDIIKGKKDLTNTLGSVALVMQSIFEQKI